MLDGQFEIDGVLFGPGTKITVRDFDPGERDVIDQDQTFPGGDGLIFGVDAEGAPEWTWELAVHATSAAEAFDLLEDIRNAWNARATRRTPGALSVIRYALPGRTRRVFGRGRRFAAMAGSVKTGWHQAYYPFLCTFRLADPIVYDDTLQQLPLTLVAPVSGGVVLPAPLPWVLGVPEGQRQGIVDVAGKTPVPFEIAIHGPSAGSLLNPWVESTGWRVALTEPIPAGDVVTVDTRLGTVTRANGQSLAGATVGRFLRARLQPGTQEVTFGGTDPTNTATAVVSWRSGYDSI